MLIHKIKLLNFIKRKKANVFRISVKNDAWKRNDFPHIFHLSSLIRSKLRFI